MSRISNRVATIGAALAIVLLVILLVILWSDVRNVERIENFHQTWNESSADRIVNKTRRKQASDLGATATHLVPTFESNQRNFTNEGEFDLPPYLFTC
jgi:hypothetical protein